jgi:hypothetical protein
VIATLTRAGLFVLVTAVAATAAVPNPDEPPDARQVQIEKLNRYIAQSYTAFPDLKPPDWKERRKPDGSITFVPDEVNAGPPLPLPTVAPDAPPLRKIKAEQVRAGMAYLARINEVIRIGSWTSQFLQDYMKVITDVFRVVVELEEVPAKRVRWYEARVHKFKELEQFVYLRVLNGNDPPQQLDRIVSLRLRAEADLLVLLAQNAAPNRTSERPGHLPPEQKPMEPPRPLPEGFRPTEPMPESPDQPPSGSESGVAFPREPVQYLVTTDPDGTTTAVTKDNPADTVFPEVKAPTKVSKRIKDRDGGFRSVVEEKDVVPLPPLPAVAPDAPLVRKVRLEQLRAGLAYIDRLREVIRIGSWTSQFFSDYMNVIAETYRVAADLEEVPARRVPWYEARVRNFKELERFTTIRVLNGSDPPQRFDIVRFDRFQSEADLLALKTAVEKGDTKRPGERLRIGPTNLSPGAILSEDEIRSHPELKDLASSLTAFPDLKPAYPERKQVTDPDGTTRTVIEEKGGVPLPPMPTVAADAPALRKVRFEELRACLRYIARVRETIRIGSWTSQFFSDYMNVIAETYRVAADLEEVPARRVPWYEARVRNFKELERFTTIRVLNGSDPPQRLDAARFERLRAEADLLVLIAEVEAVAPPVCPLPMCYCQPVPARPRCGLLARVFHRR